MATEHTADTPRSFSSRSPWREDDPLVPNTEWRTAEWPAPEWNTGPEDNPYEDDTPGQGPRDLRD